MQLTRLFLLTTLFAAASLPAQGQLMGGNQDEPLEPDKAFQFNYRTIDADTLETSWVIAEGYYLYRDKFKFEVSRGKVTLGTPVFPEGKVKEDPQFGKVVTYVHKAAIRLPISYTNDAKEVVLKVTFQGCNEPIGLCYAPITKEAIFSLPAKTVKDKFRSLKDLGQAVDAGAGSEPEFLKPDEAFRVSVTPSGAKGVAAQFEVAHDYYLYRDKISFTLTDKNGQTLKLPATLPAGKVKEDPNFGRTEIYPKSFSAGVALPDDADGKLLTVNYQGCKDQGICYLPTKKRFTLNRGGDAWIVAAADSTATDAKAATTDTVVDKVSAVPASEAADTSGEKEGYFAAITGAFLVGLLLSFTPCVLPMIPILSSIIVGQGDRNITKTRGGLLAGSYVLGTAATYTVAGILAGASGEQLQSYFQNVWAIGILSSIFVLLALSMFGFYELQMPAFIQSRLHGHSQKIKGGSFIGVFIMGMVSALIVGACVSPLLIGALTVAIVKHDPVLGASIMFAMALGMGVILIFIGIGAGALIPRAGTWMERVKHLFGVLLLGVAVYMLGTLPQVPVLLLWGALFIVTAMYFGATQPVPEGASGWRYFYKGIGTILLVWGVLSLIGGAMGQRDVLRPIPLSSSGTVGTHVAVAEPGAAHLFSRINNEAELDQQLARARTEGKAVILDFYADWCTDCVRMEKTTFTNPRVTSILSQPFVALQVDVTDPNDAGTKAIKKRFGVFGPPAVLFFDSQGNARKDLNFYGFKPVDDFVTVLDKL